MSLFSESNGINYFVIQTPKDEKFDGVILLSSDKGVNKDDVSEFLTVLEQYVPATIRVIWVGSSTVWGAYPDKDKKLFLISGDAKNNESDTNIRNTGIYIENILRSMGYEAKQKDGFNNDIEK